MSAFYRTLPDLAGKAYTDNAVRNELRFTTFIEGLANSLVRWKARKAKPTVVEDALSLALEMQSYLNLHGQQPDTPAASVNNLTGPSPSQSELFSDLIFTMKEEVKRVVDERSGPPQRGRSGERPTSSRSQQSESNNHRGQSNNSKNRVSFNNSGKNSAKECHCCYRKNHETKDCKACFKCRRVGHFWRDCCSRSQPLT